MQRIIIIDKALQTGAKFTPEELADLCEKEGLCRRVSEETIRKDILRLRKWGAPIPKRCSDRRYYYKDPQWSLSKTPLTPEDLLLLHRIAQLLDQFPGLFFAERLKQLINDLGKRYELDFSQSSRIFFQQSPKIEGLHQLAQIYTYVEEERSMQIQYLPFKYQVPKWLHISPYFLQEYNFRWYLIARYHSSNHIRLFALDRIKGIKDSEEPFRHDHELNPKTYFKDVIGVSILPFQQPQTIKLWIHPQLAPYLKTKLLHHTQKQQMQADGSMHITIHVIPNYELKAQILSWGDRVKVLHPQSLAEEIATILQNARKLYPPTK